MSVRIEVVYALAARQELVVLDLPQGATARDAVQASGLLQRFSQIDPDRLGVWGRTVMPDTPLRDRDRVEIYRPLLADPKEVRRARAANACR